MTYQEIIKDLKSQRSPKNIEGMARFGISAKNTLGISIPYLRKLGKKIGKNHDLAIELWNSGYHEARILAALIDEPEKITAKQLETWVHDFDSWDVCDQVCMNLFDKSDLAIKAIPTWAKSEEEFVRRTPFSLIAALAFHRKDFKDSDFEKYLPLIVKYSTDERNFVRKSVNWALRQIGKRNSNLKVKAIDAATKILQEHHDSKSAKWIANDAIRELKLH
jgi:3-methyladenine DNA glycosylase AlkD